jgi:hypothetical protein
MKHKDHDSVLERYPLHTHCHSSRDGDCDWKYCPQNMDGEPMKSGRHCPLDIRDREDPMWEGI